MGKQVTNLTIQLQNGTDRTVYATWSFDTTANKHTDHYVVRWMYKTKGDDTWFKENDTSEQYKQSIYNAPSNAYKVKCKVKPVAATTQSGSSSSEPWTGEFVTSDVFTIPEDDVISPEGPGDQDVPTPGTPTLTIDSNGILVASVENYKVSGATICIDVWKNDGQGGQNIETTPHTLVNDPSTWVGTSGFRAAVQCPTDTGAYYKARACSMVDGKQSTWSDFCSNVNADSPSVPSTPSVTITEEGLFTASVDNYEHRTARICFEIIENDSTTVRIQWVEQENGHAELTYQGVMGRRYKARAMVEYNGVPTQWSAFSSNIEFAGPPIPSVPSCSMANGVFYASIENYKYDGATLTFQIVENDAVVVSTQTRTNSYGRVEVSFSGIKQDGRYKARAMAEYRGIKTKWSEYSTNISAEAPDIPPVPDVTISGKTVTAVVENYVLDRGQVYIQIIEDDKTAVAGAWLNLIYNRCFLTYTAKPGSKYKARARAKLNTLISKWSDFSQNVEIEAPSAPPVPSVTIEGFKLICTIDNYTSTTGTQVYIQIVENDSKVIAGAWLTPIFNHVAYEKMVTVGKKYKARAQARLDTLYSQWSDFSQAVETVPDTVKAITSIKALTSTSVQLEWTQTTGATGYTIEYADNKDFFDAASVSSDTTTMTKRIIQNLETGKEWFFRVKATNTAGAGGWSPIASVKIGTVPDAPTTWSYTTVVKIGEEAVLNWVHNSEDNSDQTAAQIEVIKGSAAPVTYSVTTATMYNLSTAGLADSTVILWRVRTKGILNDWGKWSVQRMVTVFAPPTISLVVTPGSYKETDIEPSAFGSYPITIEADANPDSQYAVAFFVSVKSLDTYDTIDDMGNSRIVNAGEVIYEKTIANPDSNTISLTLTPGDIDLETDVYYEATVTAAMSSGLTAEDSVEFYTSFDLDLYSPDADIIFEKDKLITHIRPYCLNEYGSRILEGAKLSVYRRNYDGTFTLIGGDISMDSFVAVTDPHPALNYARYRIVAESDLTGQISYNDLAAYPIGEPSIVIQWDEEWSYFNYDDDADTVEPAWAGSLLKLPYNVDISDQHNMDVSLVEYIGRENPVAYYGTQKGETANWKCEIKKSDTETLYGIRRLARYSGDVYVREPSGTGYWAYVKVSYDISHDSPVIPVTFDVTKVEGGM